MTGRSRKEGDQPSSGCEYGVAPGCERPHGLPVRADEHDLRACRECEPPAVSRPRGAVASSRELAQATSVAPDEVELLRVARRDVGGKCDGAAVGREGGYRAEVTERQTDGDRQSGCDSN